MAVLSDNARALLLRAVMRVLDLLGEPVTVTKQELLTTINSVDQFFESNAAALNTAFPVATRTKLSATQKQVIGAWVLARRAGIL